MKIPVVVVVLNMLYTSGDHVRTMRVVKMRRANHTMRPIMFKIGPMGITEFPDVGLPMWPGFRRLVSPFELFPSYHTY